MKQQLIILISDLPALNREDVCICKNLLICLLKQRGEYKDESVSSKPQQYKMVPCCFVRESLIAPESKAVNKGQTRSGRGGWSQQGRNGAGLLWIEKAMVPFKTVLGKKDVLPIFSKIYYTHISFLDTLAFGCESIGDDARSSISE